MRSVVVDVDDFDFERLRGQQWILVAVTTSDRHLPSRQVFVVQRLGEDDLVDVGLTVERFQSEIGVIDLTDHAAMDTAVLVRHGEVPQKLACRLVLRNVRPFRREVEKDFWGVVVDVNDVDNDVGRRRLRRITPVPSLYQEHKLVLRFEVHRLGQVNFAVRFPDLEVVSDILSHPGTQLVQDLSIVVDVPVNSGHRQDRFPHGSVLVHVHCVVGRHEDRSVVIPVCHSDVDQDRARLPRRPVVGGHDSNVVGCRRFSVQHLLDFDDQVRQTVVAVLLDLQLKDVRVGFEIVADVRVGPFLVRVRGGAGVESVGRRHVFRHGQSHHLLGELRGVVVRVLHADHHLDRLEEIEIAALGSSPVDRHVEDHGTVHVVATHVFPVDFGTRPHHAVLFVDGKVFRLFVSLVEKREFEILKILTASTVKQARVQSGVSHEYSGLLFFRYVVRQSEKLLPLTFD